MPQLKKWLNETSGSSCGVTQGKNIAVRTFISFIDTLEVKEVDLNKEIDLVEDKYHGFESLSRADIIDVAKHFFELGMAVSNKAQKREEV